MNERAHDTLNRRTVLAASVGALTSAVAASSCCLPLLPFLAAAGMAGGSALLASLRPYFLAASVMFVGFGFYQAHRARQCNCRPGWISMVLLWFSAVVIALTIFFPQAVDALLAG